MFLLVVALELLGLVVAARRTLPGAVVESVLESSGLLVQVVVPGGFAFGALSARSSEGSGKSHSLIQLRNGADAAIIKENGFPVIAEKVELVRNRLMTCRTIRQYIPW